MTSSFDTLSENLRLQQVYSTVVNFGMSTAIDRTPLGGFRRRMQGWVHGLDGPVPDLSVAVKTRVMLESLGPTFVKLGQIVSSQASVLPDEWRVELDRLQNEVPPEPWEVTRQTITDELGAPPEELYAEVDHEPFAAASLGQVHRARLHDGTEVVIKVQRPHLDRQVRSDLGIARVLGGYAERRSSWARETGLRSMLDEFGTTLQEELDYYAEAYNMQRLAANLAGIPGVRVPRLYRELSGRRVLTQELVHGVKISDVAAMKAAGLDVAAVGESALQAAMKMLVVDGFFHADPHPGNLLVDLDTGVVTFLDCGMVGELTLTQRANLGLLLWTFVRGDIPAMGQQLRALSVPFREVDERAFAKDFEKKMSRYAGTNADVKEVLTAGLALLRDHGLRLDPQLTLALKAMTQSSAFFTPLAPPDRTFTEAAMEVVKEQAQAAVTAESVEAAAKQQAVRLAGVAAHEAGDYLKGLLSWREQLKKGRIQVYLDTSSLNEQMDSLKTVMSTVMVGILVAGIMIAAALAANVFAGLGQDGLARLAGIGFFVGLGLAGVLVLVFLGRILRDARRDRGG